MNFYQVHKGGIYKKLIVVKAVDIILYWQVCFFCHVNSCAYVQGTMDTSASSTLKSSLNDSVTDGENDHREANTSPAPPNQVHSWFCETMSYLSPLPIRCHIGGFPYDVAALYRQVLLQTEPEVAVVQLPDGQTTTVQGVIQAPQTSVIQSPQAPAVQVGAQTSLHASHIQVKLDK